MSIRQGDTIFAGTTGSGGQLTPWSINSGVVDAAGHNAIMGGVGTNTLTFDTSKPIVMTLADGTTYPVAAIPSQPALPSDSTFNVFFSPKYNDVRIFNNEISIQEAAPQAPSIIDTWLDTSVSPLDFKHWDGKGWVKTEYIWMGKITTVGGKITEIKNREFNFNGANERKSFVSSIPDYDLSVAVQPSMIAGRYYTFPFDCELRGMAYRNHGGISLSETKETATKRIFSAGTNGDVNTTAISNDRMKFKRGQRVYVVSFSQSTLDQYKTYIFPTNIEGLKE